MKLFNSNPSRIYLYIILLAIIGMATTLFAGFFIGKTTTDKTIQYVEITTTPKPSIPPTITPIPSPSPVTKQDVNQGKIQLHIDSIAWNDGHADGLVTENIKVTLLKMDGTFVDEKTPSKYVQDGPIGSGGDTVFYVLPSTYQVISETPNTKGTCIVTVRTTNEYNSCAIYMTNK